MRTNASTAEQLLLPLPVFYPFDLTQLAPHLFIHAEQLMKVGGNDEQREAKPGNSEHILYAKAAANIQPWHGVDDHSQGQADVGDRFEASYPFHACSTLPSGTHDLYNTAYAARALNMMSVPLCKTAGNVAAAPAMFTSTKGYMSSYDGVVHFSDRKRFLLSAVRTARVSPRRIYRKNLTAGAGKGDREMAKTKLAVHVQNGTSSQDDAIVLGEAYVKRWKIPVNQSVTLRFGAAKREVKVTSAAHLAAIRMNETLASRFGLHHGIQLCLHYKPSTRTLTIGPLIGVLVSRVYSAKPERPFGAMTAFCRELTDACEQFGGFVYFFTPEDIRSGGSSAISGWCHTERWVKRTFPVPNVVYNRLTSRKLENRPSVQQFMKSAKTHYGASVFNEKYLNKSEVFKALRGVSSLHHLLPESYLVKNYAMLKAMCKKHAIVYLKPITGSLGKGIIKISKRSGGGYACHFTSLNGVRKQEYPTLTQLFKTISGKLRTGRYQIQQGIHLIEIGGRPVDFRALVQKGVQGEWGVTSVVGRIAANNTFVSNLARGGSLATVPDAAAKSNVASSGKAGMNAKLRKAAIDIAKGTEAQIQGHFAEFGVDLAVDRSGRVWLLEVNSKPSKDDNTPAGDSKIRPSVRQLIYYSQHLSLK